MTQTALREAIAAYHDLLTEQLAADSWAQLEDQTRRHNLYFDVFRNDADPQTTVDLWFRFFGMKVFER